MFFQKLSVAFKTPLKQVVSMEKLRNLNSLNKQEFKNFINSFDIVVSDCDGVLYYTDKPLPGASDFVEELKNFNKNVYYLSNNTSLTLDSYYKNMINFGFKVNPDDILFPTISVVDYLKKKKFDKTIYVIGFEAIKEQLRKGGIKVADSGPMGVEEKYSSFTHELQDNTDVGAVLIDMDINLSYLKMLKALVYLKRPSVMLLAGGTDFKIPLNSTMNIIGPKVFLTTLEDFSGKTATVLGKPSIYLKEIITDKFKIKNDKRVLFIGDSLRQDIGFAKSCGFQSVLVLTGISSLEDAKNATENMKPDFYIRNLADFLQLMKNLDE